MVSLWPPPSEDGPAVCAEPGWLRYVDAAYAKPGGPEARVLRRDACPRCPIAMECLAHAMTVAEPGTWGGTSAKVRTQHGAPSWRRGQGAAVA